jgi:hypothetical protein
MNYGDGCKGCGSTTKPLIEPWTCIGCWGKAWEPPRERAARKAREYTIGPEAFSTKKAIEERCKRIRQQQPGTRVEGEDHAFLRALLDRHPEAARKVGCGVSHFIVVRNDIGRDNGIRVCRTDGTSEFFSTKHCMTPSTAWADYVATARREISDQTIAFKGTAYAGRETVPCAITGADVAYQDAHVDHEKPLFKFLITDFDPEEWHTQELERTAGGEWQFADREYAARWQEFHRKHAKLRITTAAANLARNRE